MNKTLEMNKTLTKEFRFSQSNLQTFDRCRKCFYLRYIDELEWPAPITDSEEQWETATKRGQLFHLLIQQSALGMDVSEFIKASCDSELVTWWNNFQQFETCLEKSQRVFSEIELSAAVGGYTVIAKFDRIILPESDDMLSVFQIVDWKTGRHKPRQRALELSWQTVVYRYVFAEVGASLLEGNSVCIDPERIELQYWHAGFPNVLQPISYSKEEHEEARGRLLKAIEEIVSLHHQGQEDVAFPRTDDESRCCHCVYRAYCERERVPGKFSEWELLLEEETTGEDAIPEGSPIEDFGNL